MICISKVGFCAVTKVFEDALNAVKFLGWLKKFVPAQNTLGPVKGQGINMKLLWHSQVSIERAARLTTIHAPS